MLLVAYLPTIDAFSPRSIGRAELALQDQSLGLFFRDRREDLCAMVHRSAGALPVRHELSICETAPTKTSVQYTQYGCSNLLRYVVNLPSKKSLRCNNPHEQSHQTTSDGSVQPLERTYFTSRQRANRTSYVHPNRNRTRQRFSRAAHECTRGNRRKRRHRYPRLTTRGNL